MCCGTGAALLYIGASMLLARLAAEATGIFYDRHLLYSDRFDK